VLFANAPQVEVDAAVEEAGETLPWMQWTEYCTCLVIESGAQRILVDTGLGDLDPSTGRLVESLADAGVAPSDVGAVIVSHGHPDHIGGLVASDGAPAFPAARVLMAEKEWEFWMKGETESVLPAEAAEMLVCFARRTLLVIEDRVEFIDKETELLPGVHCLSAPGHTPGHSLRLPRGERPVLATRCSTSARSTPVARAVDVDPIRPETRTPSHGRRRGVPRDAFHFLPPTQPHAWLEAGELRLDPRPTALLRQPPMTRVGRAARAPISPSTPPSCPRRAASATRSRPAA
jgi:hypothetical protein